MQFEVTISAYDLIDILSETARSARKFDVYLVDGTIIPDSAVRECGNDLVIRLVAQGTETDLPVDSIKAVEFEGFHKYRGVTSKIFLVE